MRHESNECSSEMRQTTDLDPDQFPFRNLHAHVLIGTGEGGQTKLINYLGSLILNQWRGTLIKTIKIDPRFADQ